MAGVKKFDREDVLDKAMATFWEKGYEGASIGDLVSSTGLNRGSLYATFGDKEGLFTEVLDRYNQQFAAQLAEALAMDDPRQALETFFDRVITRMEGGSCPRGCLYTNTAVASVTAGETMQRKLAGLMGGFESLFYQTLLRAQGQGLLAPGRDIRALSRMLTAVAHGMSVLHRANPDTTPQRDIAREALRIWDR